MTDRLSETTPEAISDHQPRLVDLTGAAMASCAPQHAKPARDWPPVIVPGETIDREIERLADLPRPANGQRRVMFVHPSAPDPGRGLTPGVQVTLDVLLPGESTVPVRRNATEVNFCIRGSGTTTVGERTIRYRRYDAWNHPSYQTYRHVNDGREVSARLTYSNAALLEMMRVNLVEEDPPVADPGGAQAAAAEAGGAPALETFTIGEDGAALMPYETLISPPCVPSASLHWPWAVVKENLDKLEALGSSYVGRRLYLLFNPRTGRFNGTTPNFFATLTIRPGGIVDKPHRHVSSAINYYFRGAGYSRVEGRRYEWKAGDLMVSAPGWAVHNHASYEGEPVYELTIQDQPLNIYMESLLWQEELSEPARILGTQQGFSTNRGRH